MKLKWISILSLCLCLLSCFSPLAHAQNLLDDNLDEDKAEDTPLSAEKGPPLVNESIKKISRSQKIFILTNDNQAYGSGDFISLLIQNKLVCRALVAKNSDEKLAGIKIIKIYSLDLWKQLSPGKDVQVLRGDDSFYSSPKLVEKTKEKKGKNVDKIQSEDDLYNSTKLDEDDSTVEENSKRKIKTDNLLALNVGMIDGVDETGAGTRYTHLNGTWAYQIADNVFSEFTLGSNTVRDLPAIGIDTRMVSYSVRLKYTISAPFYSYIQPYVGYQVITAQSPGAESVSEFEMVDKLKKSRVIAGATILRRIVPGWFARVDFGSDILNGGLLLEF